MCQAFLRLANNQLPPPPTSYAAAPSSEAEQRRRVSAGIHSPSQFSFDATETGDVDDDEDDRIGGGEDHRGGWDKDDFDRLISLLSRNKRKQ